MFLSFEFTAVLSLGCLSFGHLNPYLTSFSRVDDESKSEDDKSLLRGHIVLDDYVVLFRLYISKHLRGYENYTTFV